MKEFDELDKGRSYFDNDFVVAFENAITET